MKTTTLTVSEAIKLSKSRTQIVHVHADARTGEHDSFCGELMHECEGFVDANNGTQEFWGVDCEGVEWRVHVHAQHGVSEVFEEVEE